MDIVSDELKKCPFCGGKARIESWPMSQYELSHIIGSDDNQWYQAYCSKCYASGPECA